MQRIIPENVQLQTTVQIVLPPEATAILRDLHRDREGIALGGLVLLACVVALTFKRVLHRSA